MAAFIGHSYVRNRRCESCYHGVMAPSETTVCSSGTIYVCGSCGSESHFIDTHQSSHEPSKLTKSEIKNIGKTKCKKCKTWFINSVGCPNGCKGSY